MPEKEDTQDQGKESEAKAEPDKASEAEGPTSPSKPVELEATAKFIHPRHPDQEIAGDELWQGYNRGQQADKLTSDLHKTESKLTEVSEELAILQAEKAQREQNDSITQRLEELGIPKASKAVSEGSDNWLTEGEEKPIDPKAILAELTARQESDRQKDLASRDEAIAAKIAETFNVEKQKQAENLRQQKFMDSVRSAKASSLASTRPDIPEKTILEIVDAEQAASYADLQAAQLSNDGKQDEAIDRVLDAEGLRKKGAELRSSTRDDQAQKQREQEAAAELEGLSRGRLPGEDEPKATKHKTLFKPDEVLKARKSRLERAKELIKRTVAAKGQFPG